MMGNLESIEQPTPKEIPLAERATSTPERQEKFAELQDRVTVLTSLLNEAFGAAPSQEQKERAVDLIREELIRIAQEARLFAINHRKFFVGAVVLGLRAAKDPEDNPWTILFDANTKPKPGPGSPKWCAEQYLMDRITGEEERLEEVLAFVTVGPVQRDDRSQRPQITLTPCEICRDRLLSLTEEEHPIVTKETEVLTVNADDFLLRKVQRVKDLHRFHGEFRHLED